MRSVLGRKVRVDIYVNATALPGTTVSNTVRVSSDTADPDINNNVITFDVGIPYPPVVDRVRGGGSPYRIVITGANFHEFTPGRIFVFLGADLNQWMLYRAKSENKVILTGRQILEKGISYWDTDADYACQ